MTNAERLLKRAGEATRSSKRVAVKSELDWPDLVRDIAAMANSGGGVVVVEASDIEEEELHEQLERFLEPEFEELEVHGVARGGGTQGTAIVVDGVVGGPVLFARDGRRGQVYFRHGARSEPASGPDVRDFILRQLDATRKQWISNIRHVMHAPDRAEVAIIETAERDEEGRPTLIRLTTDPHAPLYGQVDPDHSHPYRQKEVIAEVNERLDGDRAVNAFDMLSVRRVYDITEASRPEFVHVPKFGSPQYSDAFVDWIVDRDRSDADFFGEAKTRYLATRRKS
jgi:EC042_2821-lke REase